MFYIVYNVFCGYVMLAYSETAENSLFEEDGELLTFIYQCFTYNHSWFLTV